MVLSGCLRLPRPQKSHVGEDRGRLCGIHGHVSYLSMRARAGWSEARRTGGLAAVKGGLGLLLTWAPWESSSELPQEGTKALKSQPAEEEA